MDARRPIVLTAGHIARADAANLFAARLTSAGALLFSCVGRGELLYGRPGHDSGAFHQALGDIPLGGFFCNGEVGPVGGKTFLHGYTSAFALFRRRGALA